MESSCRLYFGAIRGAMSDKICYLKVSGTGSVCSRSLPLCHLSRYTYRKQHTLVILRESLSLCVCYVSVWESKGKNLMKVRCQTFQRSKIVAILPYLFILYTDRESGRTSSSYSTWSKVSSKLLSKFLISFSSQIQKLSLSFAYMPYIRISYHLSCLPSNLPEDFASAASLAFIREVCY